MSGPALLPFPLPNLCARPRLRSPYVEDCVLIRNESVCQDKRLLRHVKSADTYIGFRMLFYSARVGNRSKEQADNGPNSCTGIERGNKQE